MKWLILLLGVASNASASVLIKMAMMPPRRTPSLGDPIAALGNWPFWLGLFLYGATFLFYMESLSRLPLNIAHPVMTTGAVAAVAVLSVVVFREPMYWTTVLGIVFVLIGVLLITLNMAA